MPARVVGVQIDERHALPRAECRLALGDGEHERRAHERGQQVVGAVAGRAVRVPVAVVAGEEPLERRREVVLRTGAELHQRQPGRRVRREHVHQAVAPTATELGHVVRDVEHALTRRVEIDPGSLHERILPDFPESPAVEAARWLRGSCRWGAIIVCALAISACAPIRPADGPGGNGRVPLRELARVRQDCWVDRGIADALVAMLEAANADGVALAPEGYFSHDPIPVSGCYRTYDEQVIARGYFYGLGACATAAQPGTSRHGTGRAVDFRDDAGELTFESAGYAWLLAHAGEYGFFHPEWARPDGGNPEPWHWEA